MSADSGELVAAAVPQEDMSLAEETKSLDQQLLVGGGVSGNPLQRRNIADFEVNCFTRFMMVFPGLVTWIFLVLSVVAPFFLPTTSMLLFTLYVVWSAITLTPITFSLLAAVRKIAAAARTPREELCEEGPPYHAFVIPNYKEDYDILTEVLRKLASHRGARNKYIVVLAMEGREQGSGDKAMRLAGDWHHAFRHISHSTHQGGIPGECAGKASNAAAGGRHLVNVVIPELAGVSVDEVICTVLDADILLGQDYMELLEMSLRRKAGNLQWHRTMFIPYMAFSNTEGDAAVPRVNALYDLFWGAMVLATLEHDTCCSPVKYPCSTYSISLLTLREMDFWEVGDVGLGEDHHTALRLYFTYEENARYELLYAPFRATHVGGTSWCNGVMNRYEQAKRHYLACVDVSYTAWRTWKQRRTLPLCGRLRTMHEVFLHFLNLTLNTAVTGVFFAIAGIVWVLWPGIDGYWQQYWFDVPNCAAWGIHDAWCSDYHTTIKYWFIGLTAVFQVQALLMGAILLPCVEWLNFRHQWRLGCCRYVGKLICRWIWAPLMILFVFFPAVHAFTLVLCGRKMIYKTAPKQKLIVDNFDDLEKQA